MNNPNFLIDFIRARALQCALSYHAIQDDTQEAEKALCYAQSEALCSLAEEIQSSLPLRRTESFKGSAGVKRQLWVFSTEIGGSMAARVFLTEEEATEAQRCFMQKYKMETEYEGYAVCGIKQVLIAPRRMEAMGSLDCRYVLVVYDMHVIQASIHESEEEVERAIKEFKLWHNYDDDESSSLYDYHEILIPQ